MLEGGVGAWGLGLGAWGLGLAYPAQPLHITLDDIPPYLVISLRRVELRCIISILPAGLTKPHLIRNRGRLLLLLR